MELACETEFTNTSAVLDVEIGVELGLSRVLVVDVIEDAVNVLKLTGNEEMA